MNENSRMTAVQRVANIAEKHAHTIQVCVDRLHELGAESELRALASVLQRLAFRAAPPAENGSKRVQR